VSQPTPVLPSSALPSPASPLSVGAHSAAPAPLSCLSLLRELVAIPSVNPFRLMTDGKQSLGVGCETAMNLALETHLRALGFEVTRQLVCPQTSLTQDGEVVSLPERWNLLATKSPPKGTPSKGSLLFLAHTDTVDVKQGWKSDPFAVTERTVEGHLRWYGLGTNDMKGGIAAILDAASRAAPSGYTLKIAFVVDEEFYSFGAHTLCASDFLADVKLALVPEIGDNTEDRETQWIGLGRLGRSEFEIELTGKACHGADAFMRKDSVNAVHAALALGAELAHYCKKKKQVFTSHGIESTNAAYVSFVAGGAAILSVPDRARMVIDRTLVPEESPEQELEQLSALIAKAKSSGIVDERCEISVRERPRPTPACKPYFFSPDLSEVRFVTALVQKHNARTSFGIGRSVADENRLALLGIPTVILGPFGAGSHTPEEWVDPESVLRVARIFTDVIEQFGEQPFLRNLSDLR
jgi:acetylornithine deacetylase